MSVCTTTSDECCDTTVPTTSAAGKKISQLNILDPIIAKDDYFVVLDVTANETKRVTYETVLTYQNSGTNLSADKLPEAIIELDQELTVHIDDYGVHFPISAISGLAPNGGDTGQALVKDSNDDYNYSWHDVSSTGTGIPDVHDSDNYLRTNGAWVQSDSFDESDYYTSGDVDNIIGSISGDYTTTADFESHISDIYIHYDMSAIDHTVIQNIGVNSHDQIDTHIGTTNIHTPLNDSVTTDNNLWSANQTQDKFDEKETYLGTQLIDGQVLVSSGSDIRYWSDAGVPEAPIDTIPYAREDGSWVNIYGYIPDTFTDLQDTPNDYLTHAGKVAVVNNIETGIEFTDNSFDNLIDTPISKVGMVNKILSVNITEDSLEYVDEYDGSDKLSLIGGTLTGPLELDADPLVDNEATTKRYVDELVIIKSGINDNRPLGVVVIGTQYFSTDLGYPIWFNGVNWVTAAGAYVLPPRT